ncbi:hypothetical protein [Leifsonia sp. Leaf264]|uniref:hypothetical protein n=1 Tax=Leifsonia sp. Leaf264 TaxID=1736314 RepID=UPI0006F22072|nr:hypothetical protein [Leifsonia sp. Leaf264]KQO98147.1 hypothetical protein ASF30_08795 [Leifsonia sp. Leaf264]
MVTNNPQKHRPAGTRDAAGAPAGGQFTGKDEPTASEVTLAPADEYVTVPCWKCGGSGDFAYGVCWGCEGSGTNTYTAAAYKRKQAAAKARRTADERRNDARRDARLATLHAMTWDELRDDQSVSNLQNHDGSYNAFALNEDGTTNRDVTEYVDLDELTRRMWVKLHPES